MEVHKKQLSFDEKKLICKDLVVYVESEYAPSKRYLIYTCINDIYTVPICWAEKYLPHLTSNISFNTNVINIKDSSIILRPLQEECIKNVIPQFEKNYGGGIINLNVGLGKTVISLYLIAKYKYKTLIVVNTVELLNQWKKAITQFLPDARIGIIRGSKFETDNKDIVIGMLKTISMKKEYTKKKFECFSCVFIDEVHHIASEVFNKALIKIRVKYTFGLSATVERKDHLEKVFFWHLGPILFSDNGTVMKQKSIIIRENYRGNSTKEMFMYNGDISVSKMISNLAEDTERTNKICNILKNLSSDRKVLVLSDRVFQLKQIHKILGEEISGLFIGGITSENREESKSKKILLATYAIASEGFNHPELNTLLFATPRSSVKQAIGRIYRKQHSVKPMIIDIVDTVGVFIAQYRKRKAIYDIEIIQDKHDKDENQEQNKEVKYEFIDD